MANDGEPTPVDLEEKIYKALEGHQSGLLRLVQRIGNVLYFDKKLDRSMVVFRHGVTRVKVASVAPLFELLTELHKHKYVHRDVRPENIMLDTSVEPAEWKLIDFGFCCQATESMDSGKEPFAGTITYASDAVCSNYCQPRRPGLNLLTHPPPSATSTGP